MIKALMSTLRTMSPKLAALVGPQLAAWMANPENRDRAAEQFRRLTSRSAEARLLARLDLASITLQELQEDERAGDGRRAAAGRALDEIPILRSRLRLPHPTRKARRESRRRVTTAFDQLMKNLDEEL